MICEYCEGKKTLHPSSYDGEMGYLEIFIDKKNRIMTAQTLDYTSHYEANYCPMCGSKLSNQMTNWEAKFGTPEKTANSLRALIGYHVWEDCAHCFLNNKRDGGCLAVMDEERLEWLQEEAS